MTRGRHGALTCGPNGVRWEVPALSRRRRRPHGRGRRVPVRHGAVRRGRNAAGDGGAPGQRRRRAGGPSGRQSSARGARRRPTARDGAPRVSAPSRRLRAGAAGREPECSPLVTVRRLDVEPRPPGRARHREHARPDLQRTSRSSSWTTARPTRRPRCSRASTHRDCASSGSRRTAESAGRGTRRSRRRAASGWRFSTTTTSGRRTISRASAGPGRARLERRRRLLSGAASGRADGPGHGAAGGDLVRARLRSARGRGWLPLVSATLHSGARCWRTSAGSTRSSAPWKTRICGCGSLSGPTSPARPDVLVVRHEHAGAASLAQCCVLPPGTRALWTRSGRATIRASCGWLAYRRWRACRRVTNAQIAAILAGRRRRASSCEGLPERRADGAVHLPWSAAT